MGIFRDMIEEARQSTVPTEYRIALGQLKRMYNDGEVPEKKELLKDVEMIAKKNHLDSDKFLEFALAQFKMNEAKMMAKDLISFADENGYGIGQDGRNGYYITKANGSKQRYLGTSKEKEAFNILKDVISNKIKFESLKIMNESAVGTPGRTTVKDAEDHINDELLAEFKKIIKKLGGKTVAKVLLDKLGQKAEIKDEIDHIEDIIDNSNY